MSKWEYKIFKLISFCGRFSVDDVNLFCNGVLTQFFMEMVNDETLLKNHPDAIADIKQRFDPAIAVISERVFPKDAFESALGAPYAEYASNWWRTRALY